MGEYVLNSPMLSIPMGGADVVLGVQWLQYLGMVAINFQEGRPISFESCPIKGNYLHIAIYEKEKLEILHALNKW